MSDLPESIEDRIKDVLELHSQSQSGYCEGCYSECQHCEGEHAWPCDTRRLLVDDPVYHLHEHDLGTTTTIDPRMPPYSLLIMMATGKMPGEPFEAKDYGFIAVEVPGLGMLEHDRRIAKQKIAEHLGTDPRTFYVEVVRAPREKVR
jgi:hypothetical protein